MKVKYFQELAYMMDWQEQLLHELLLYQTGDTRYKHKLEKVNLNEDDGVLLHEELDATKYMVASYYGYTQENEIYGTYGNDKPTVEVMTRALNRYLGYIQENSKISLKVLQHADILEKKYKKRVKFVRHYLFKFSLEGWYERLPEYVPTYREHFKDIETEEDIPIPASKNS